MLRVTVASDTRADSILAGCVVGVLATYGRLPGVGPTRLITAALGILFVLYLIGFGNPESFGLSLIAAFFAGVLILMLSDPPKLITDVLSHKGLVWIGKLSYSLYLWHLYANFVIERSGIDRRFWIGASIPLAFAFAVASYYLIERPFLSLKKRYSVIA